MRKGPKDPVVNEFETAIASLREDCSGSGECVRRISEWHIQRLKREKDWRATHTASDRLLTSLLA